MTTDASTAAAEKPRKARGDAKKAFSGENVKSSGAYLPDIHRALPHSDEAEKGALCSMLLSPKEAIGTCVERLSGVTEGEHFHIPAHQTIYQALVELWNTNQAIDFITLTQHLRDRGQLNLVGGAAFITELSSYVPTAANLEYYLDIVSQKYVLRKIIAACTVSVTRAYDEQDEVMKFLDDVEREIFSITDLRIKSKEPTMRDMVIGAIESIEKLYENRGSITGLPTGFEDLDKMTNGLHPGEMFIVAARPSMGKTAFAMNIAEHVALEAQKAVAIFSLEMSSQQLVQRILCSRARVNLQRVRDGFLSDRDFPSLTDAGDKLAKSQIYIDDSAGLSIMELRAKARRYKAKHDIQLIVIDYLQLLKSTSRKAQDNRQIEISEISYGIKALAKELSIPIIVLAQLNRQPEQRSGGRPRLSDLRESGSIEQDADVVGLLVREEYYAEDEEAKQEAEGKAELIIAKQRNGPVGDVPLTFFKQFTRFENRSSRPEAHGG